MTFCVYSCAYAAFIGRAKPSKDVQWKTDLFNINSPFMMDSQVERIRREVLTNQSDDQISIETSAQRKRRKKRNRHNHVSAEENEIILTIEKNLPRLIELARQLKHLEDIQLALRGSGNNELARLVANYPGCGDTFSQLCYEIDFPDAIKSISLTTGQNRFSSASEIVGVQVMNKQESPMLIEIEEQSYVIPAGSCFLTSSFSHFITNGASKLSGTGFDLIVVDPPWANKSVKRKKSYSTLSVDELVQIPMGCLCRPGALVCVWVTNNVNLQDDVKNTLFPAWGITYVALWIWMKITSHGEPVTELTSPHKKPYELLIIGQWNAQTVRPNYEQHQKDLGCRHETLSEESTKVKQLKDDEEKNSLKVTCERIDELMDENQHNSFDGSRQKYLPKQFLLASVPCALHSKKPGLSDVLKPYLPNNAQCLELFARNLTQSWTSWGNEPLRHQHIDFFENLDSIS